MRVLNSDTFSVSALVGSESKKFMLDRVYAGRDGDFPYATGSVPYGPPWTVSLSIPALSCPSLVIYGDDFPNERGRAIARRYSCQERDFPGLDHWALVLEGRVRQAIREFLEVPP